MKPRIAIVAALPREIAPLVQDWPVRVVSRTDGTMTCECEHAVAVCAGVGRDRVAHALALAAKQGPLRAIISVGYAGALRSGIVLNSIHWAATIIDSHSGQRYDCEQGSGTLVTADHVLGREEKREMAERWNADLVDMEASTVARLAAEQGLPFRALKVVSDEADEAIPDFNRFINPRGGFREAAFAGHIALHPWLIPYIIRLGRRSKQGSQAMAQALRGVLEDAE